MNKIFTFFIFVSYLLADECESLSAKYQTPDASKLSVNQIYRWIEKNFDYIAGDACKLELCMIKMAKDYNYTKKLLKNKGGHANSDDILEMYRYKTNKNK